MPEYPEFAWTEGVVNALTHRNYSIRGNHITVIMYDDRLEIKSPGKLPNIVTIENMKEERYSRNPKIARILSEFGWVKELNEGVKRIYSEMQQSFLHDPIYSEPGDNVLLVLENNIINRTIRRFDTIQSIIGKDTFRALSVDELLLLQYAFNVGRLDSKTASKITGKSTVYVRQRLQKLEALGLLKWNGSNKNDPTQYYSFANK
jgi:ATP-dependent DNA helicase RecG